MSKIVRLVKVIGKDKTVYLEEKAAGSLLKMINDARRDGIDAPMLLPVSGYRSYEEQIKLFEEAVRKYGNEELADNYVARPGNGPHQTGRAVDLYLGKNTFGEKAAQSTDAWKWLNKNAGKYGFYPYELEPWHWEYGAPHSTNYKSEIDNTMFVKV